MALKKNGKNILRNCLNTERKKEELNNLHFNWLKFIKNTKCLKRRVLEKMIVSKLRHFSKGSAL